MQHIEDTWHICSGCTDIFKESLDQLEAILMLLPPGAEIVIMADLNADLGHLGGGQVLYTDERTRVSTLSLYLQMELCINSSSSSVRWTFIYL